MAEENKNNRDNTILVGIKPAMAYVIAAMTQFSSGQNEIHIRARGKAISRAVDVAEIVRRKFLKDVKIKDIQISTEEREIQGKGKINVSVIAITLAK